MNYLIFFILFIVFFSPFLLFPFFIGLFLFLPFFIFFQSIQILTLVPVSLWQTFTDKQVRRNHALEHATANILEQHYGCNRVAGMAFKDGFILRGLLPPPDILMEAAREGLQRLKRGETHLAIHPRCGTSLAVGQFFIALLYLIFFLFVDTITMTHVMLGILLYIALAKPLGLLAQKYLTTSTDVEDLRFVDVSIDPRGQIYFLTDTVSKPAVFRINRLWREFPSFDFFRYF